MFGGFGLVDIRCCSLQKGEDFKGLMTIANRSLVVAEVQGSKPRPMVSIPNEHFDQRESRSSTMVIGTHIQTVPLFW